MSESNINLQYYNDKEIKNFINVAQNKNIMQNTKEFQDAVNFMFKILKHYESMYTILEIKNDMTENDKTRILSNMEKLSENGYFSLAIWISKDNCPFLSLK